MLAVCRDYQSMATVYHCAVNSGALDNPAQCGGHAAELFAVSLLRLYQVHTMKYPSFSYYN